MVLVDVAHKDIQVVLYLQLVGERIAHESDQESVALDDEVLVVFVVIGGSVHSLLDEGQSDIGNTETSHQPLVLLVGGVRLLFE